MKVISLWQPWATLWLLSEPDEKIFETRNWHTPYRGKLMVHAGKKQDGEVREALKSSYFQGRLAAHGIRVDQLAFGAVIGCVDLIDCRAMRTMDYPVENEREMMAGHWAEDRFAWQRGPNPRLFGQAVPVRGLQKIFEVPDRMVIGV